MKQCTRCNRLLENDAFNKRSSAKSGLRSECRECQSEVSKGYPGPARPKGQERTRYLKKRVNGVNMPIHRIIMEQLIGRKLLPDEVVHHINGNRHDNRPENLTLLPLRFHCAIHNIGRKLSSEQRKKLSEAGKLAWKWRKHKRPY